VSLLLGECVISPAMRIERGLLMRMKAIECFRNAVMLSIVLVNLQEIQTYRH